MSPRIQTSQLLRQAFSDGFRVALTGPAGTGKTTFAKYLQSTFGATLEPERVETWLRAENLPNHWSLTPGQELNLQQFLFAAMEQSSANVFDRFGADRMFFANEAQLPLPILNELNERAAKTSRDFDAVVFFPFHWRFLRDDGVRKVSAIYQNRMASFIFNWLVSVVDIDRRLMIYNHTESSSSNAQNLLKFISPS